MARRVVDLSEHTAGIRVIPATDRDPIGTISASDSFLKITFKILKV